MASAILNWFGKPWWLRHGTIGSAVKQGHDDRHGVLLTLDRGIQVLEEVARQQGNATAKGLSASVGVNLGTCYQLLRTLQVNGYVTRLPGSRYTLGPRLAFLVDHFKSVSAPPPELEEILRDLHSELGESVYCSLRRGTRIEIAAFLDGTKAVRVAPMHMGYSDHPHARASGKCFLAFVDRRELETFVDKGGLVAMTPNTITDWGEFVAELDAVRKRGFAIDHEEFNEGVSCVGSVLVGHEGVAMGAFAVALPASRFDEGMGKVVEHLLEAGRRGSEVLGYEGPYPPPP